MKLPDIIDSEREWIKRIDKLSLEEKILIKKKCEFILNMILAKNRSISVEHNKNMEIKTDKLRKKFDIRNKDEKELTLYQRSQVRMLKKLL